jgi:hypothetical protein
VSQAGAYSVVVEGLCRAFESAPVGITVLDSPLPIPQGDTIPPNSTATLTAVGDLLLWYDAPVGGNLINEGAAYMTDVLEDNTTYWVANTTIYDEPNQFVGMENFQGTAPIGDLNFNGAIVFDCHAPFKLANAGVRKID